MLLPLIQRETEKGVLPAAPPGSSACYDAYHKQKGKYNLYRIMDKCRNDRIRKEVGAFNMQVFFPFADLSTGVFARTVEALIRRHESLRTVFTTVGEEVKQLILPYEELGRRIGYVNLEGVPDNERIAREMAKQLADKEYDFSAEPPYNFHLFHLAPHQQVVLLTINHIIADDWSVHLLVKDYGLLYAAYCRNESPALEPLSYGAKEYAAWEREMLTGNEQKYRQYWSSQLAGELPVFYLQKFFSEASGRTVPCRSYREQLFRELRTDFAGVTHAEQARLLGLVHRVSSHEGTFFRLVIDDQLHGTLKELACASNTSVFVLLMTALAIHLRILTGNGDVIIGFDSAIREHNYLDAVVGWLMNTVLLRVSVDDSVRIRDFIPAVNAKMREVNAHKLYPIDKVLQDADISLDALGALYVNYNYSEGVLTDYQASEGAKGPCYFDVDCFLNEYRNAIELKCRYKDALFPPGVVKAIFVRYIHLLQQLVALPDAAIAEFTRSFNY